MLRFKSADDYIYIVLRSVSLKYVRIREGGPILIVRLRFAKESYFGTTKSDHYIYRFFRSAQKFHFGTTESAALYGSTETSFWNYVERADNFLYCILGPPRNSFRTTTVTIAVIADSVNIKTLRSLLSIISKGV